MKHAPSSMDYTFANHGNRNLELMQTPSCVVVQVKCVAVVPLHHTRSLDMFMKDVFKVAPLLNSVDTDGPHSELAVGTPKGPVVSQDAQMLQLLAKPVTVSKFLFLLLRDGPCLMFGEMCLTAHAM